MTLTRWTAVVSAACLAAHVIAPRGYAQTPQDSDALRTSHTLPLSFEQTSAGPAPTFVSRRPTHTLTLTREGAALTVPRTGAAGKTLHMTLVDANRAPEMTGLEPLPGKVYHATAASRGTLAGNVAYARVKYADVYRGIDVVYYGNERELEFDFLVDADQDPRQIRLAFSGADGMRLERDGELAFTIGADEIRLKKPRLYQERDGIRQHVNGEYRIVDARSHEVAFHVGRYDRTRPLVIDPTIVFATYRGGALGDFPRQIKVNAIGESYLFADTHDPSTLPRNHPHQTFPLAVPQPGFTQCFLTKLSRDGTAAQYTVIFEGAGCQAMDLAPEGVAPEPKVHLHVGTSFHYQRTLTEEAGGGLRLDPLQGAYDACALGSCGPVRWMRADAQGNVYFIIEYPSPGTTPTDFIVELRKVDGSGRLVGAIELIRPPIDVQPGGNYIWDQITGLDIDDSGRAYVIGIAATPGLITPTANAFRAIRPSGDACTDPLREPCFDAFLLEVDTTTPGQFEISYASYLGGVHDDRAFGVAWDPSSGDVYITGVSRSSNFPTTTGSYFPQPPGGFVVKMDLDAFLPSQQLVFGTFLRSADPVAIAVLPDGLPAIIGSATDSMCGTTSCFPLVNSLYPMRFGRNRPFLSVLSADGAALRFSTFLDNLATADSFVSAVASNASPIIYAAMTTNDASLATAGALQPTPTGDYDTLVQAITVADLLAPNDPPEIAFSPATISVPAAMPAGAIVPLICGRLFTCAIDDPDGDWLTHIVWLGPDGYRLSNPGALPAPTSRPGIIPGDFVVLAPGSHTFTLLARDERGEVGSATLTIEVSPDNTLVGTEQRVVLTDPKFVHHNYRPLGSEHPIALTFAEVTTAGLTWLESRSDFVPPPPPGLQAGSPPYYYDIRSTAAFTGNIRLCFNIRGMSFARPQDELQIYAASGGTWTALENQAALNSDTICGDTTALGTFAIFYPQVPETAIAMFAGTGVAEDAIDGPGGDPLDDFAEAVPATQSTLTRPDRLARDGAGNIYVADNGSPLGSRIRRIDTTGVVSTVVPPGVCHGFSPIAVDGPLQRLYCVQWNQVTALRDIIRVDLPTLAETPVASASEVLAMAVDAAGNLFYSDGLIYRVPAGGGTPQLVFAFENRGGALTLPYYDRAFTLAFDAAGHLLAGGFTLIRISPGADGVVDGSPDEAVAHIGGIPGVNAVGYSQPFSGDGLPASEALLIFTYQMIVAADGAVIFTDQHARTRRIDPGADRIVDGDVDEIVRTVAGYFFSTATISSAFATSEYTDFRGLLEDPRAPGYFIGSSHGRHKLQRFGLPPGTAVEQRADLEVTAQPSSRQAFVNTPVTFNVVLTNHGPAAARDAGVLLPIPSGATVIGATSSAGGCFIVFGRPEWFCDAGTMSPGASVGMTFQLRPGVAGDLTATFEAITSVQDPVPANNIATAAVVVTHGIDLAVAATAVPNQVHALQPFTYTVTMSNLSPTVTQVGRVNATLAPNLRFDSATPAGICSLLGNELTCDVEPLAGNATVVITINVTPLTVGTLTSIFTVSNPEGDPNPANNSRSIEVLVDGIFIAESIHVSDGPPAVTPAVMIPPISETIHVSDGPPAVTPAVMIPPINETIHVSDGSPTFRTGPNVAIQKHILDDRGLAYDAGTVDAGQTARFRLRVTNTGADVTTGPVTVTDVLDTRLAFAAAASDLRCGTTDGRTVVCAAPPPLAPGASDDFVVAAVIAHDAAPPNQTVDLVNQATVATANDENANDNSASVTLTVRGIVPPSVFVTKEVVNPRLRHQNGDLVAFRLTVTNRRNASGNPLEPPTFGPTFAPISVTDTLDPRLTVVTTGSDPRCTAIGQAVGCLVSAPFPPGGTTTLDVVARIADDVAPVGGQVTIPNTAHVTTLGDIDTSDNTSTTLLTVNGAPGPELSVTKSVVDMTSPCGVNCQEATVSSGDEVRFRIATTLASLGGRLTGTITVTDTLPAGLTLIAASGLQAFPRFICANVGQQITCTLHGWESMNPGDVNEFEIVARAAAGLDQTLTLTNTAAASTPNEGITGDNTTPPVTVRVVGPRSPDVSIVKTIVNESAPCGFTCQEIVVSNGAEVRFRLTTTLSAAGGPLTGPITISDTLPAGLVPIAAFGTSGTLRFACGTSGQQATCSLLGWQAMNPGDETGVEIIAQVGPNVAGLNATVPLINAAAAVAPNDPHASNDTSAPVTVRVVGPQAPDVSIAKSVYETTLPCGRSCQDVTVSNGAEIDFVIDVHVAETGAPPVGPVTFTDNFPIGLVPLRTDGGDFSCVFAGQLVTCRLLPAFVPIPGDTFTAFIIARVGDTVAGLNQTVTLVNIATAATPEDRTTGNDTSQPVAIRVQGPRAGAPTGAGMNVIVQPTDGNNVPQPITLTFAGVTQAGLTTAVPIVPPPQAPAGFQFRGTAYEISTTATVTPPIEVCFIGAGFTLADRIWHAGMLLPDTAHTVTTSTRICARVSSLSPFAVAAPLNHAPTADAGAYPPFEATSPAGARATLTASAHDSDGDPLSFTWVEGGVVLGAGPTIAPVLAIGTHAVTLTVDDGRGGTATDTTHVIVRDTTAPILTLPASAVADATSPAGAAVTYVVSASDVADTTPSLTCSPPSGSVFPVGTSAVVCTAVDESTNSRTGTFNVHVRGAVDQILALIDKTLLFLDRPALRPVLRARLLEAATAMVNKKPAVACRVLNAYIAAVTQAPPRALTAAETSELIADANRIKAVIACR